MAILFGSVLPWLLLTVGIWLGYQHIRQNGRILLRLESIEERLAPRAAGQSPPARGMPSGSVAPDFELLDLNGQKHKLSAFRGKHLLLIFFNPKCGYCTQITAQLAALPVDGSGGRPVPIVVTTGDVEDNRKLVEESGIRCSVLIQKEMEVASQYRAAGTPMGYRINVEGRIVSELAVGGEPVLQLADADWRPQSHVPGHGSKAHGKEPDPSLSRSRINRSGLKAGSQAPEFRLPRIDGGELSLSDLRGQRVLLVFSDPDCGPCDELAPRLQELHRERSDLRVVVISRREIEASRAKAESLGLTYSIVVQKQWEVSLKYGMFATPIAYLIDENGVVLRDVAVGMEPILALANESLSLVSSNVEPSMNGSVAPVGV